MQTVNTCMCERKWNAYSRYTPRKNGTTIAPLGYTHPIHTQWEKTHFGSLKRPKEKYLLKKDLKHENRDSLALFANIEGHL